MNAGNFSRFKRAVLACAVALAAPNAFAQGFDAVRLFGAAPGQDAGRIGLAAVAGPSYAGSQNRRLRAFPALDYQWANGWFAGISNGIGYNFSETTRMQYGLRLTADLGRRERRDPALRGMGDIDASATAGAFFNYVLPGGFLLTSSLRHGSGNDRDGSALDLGAGHSLALHRPWRLGVGVAATLVNAAYMQSHFGVTPRQAAASGYAVYTPGAGARDVRASLALSYSFDARTSLTTALSVSSLLGDAKGSPLTKKASAVSGVVALGYAF
jgi:MipA family protein